jgi:hypothetical protein
MTILHKFIICEGCRKKTTISFKSTDITKVAKCSFCLKITEHKLKPKKKTWKIQPTNSYENI